MSRSSPAVAHRPSNPLRAFAERHPVTTLCCVAIALVVPLQMALLVAGLDVTPGKLAELVILVGLAVLITAWIGGRGALRVLFEGLTRGRIGIGRWLLLLLAMPILTVGVGAVSGTLRAPRGGWAQEAFSYVLILILIAVTASIWEETVWAGFVQGRLMARHGLLVGSLLTAIPFALIHVPLAFEGEGWAGTSWQDALVNWAFLVGTAPFLRYVAGALLVDTGGSVLAVAVLHASFNASGALSSVPGGWQYAPALVVLTLGVVVYRTARGRSFVAGYAPALLVERQPG